MTLPESRSDRVTLTLKGRISQDLACCLDDVHDLRVGQLPRHTVLVTRTGDVADLVQLMRALEGRGIVVDRVTHARA